MNILNMVSLKSFVTKLVCGSYILMITLSGAYSLDFWSDPRFQDDWTDACLNGQLQSPIAIPPRCGRTYLSHLNLDFKNFDVPIKQVTVTNAGRQVVFDWNRTETERSVTVDAPAERVAPFKAHTEYILQNIHVHHGKNEQTGTMHSVDGSLYAMEMHLLFVLKEFNGNVSAGFTALGNTLEIVVLWQLSNTENSAWSQLNDIMISKQLKESEKVTGIVDIRFSDFLPRRSRYTLYHGSLPASHCLEVITWIIYDYVMKFDTADLGMRHFKYISDGKEILLDRNTRHIQSQNKRPVYEGKQEMVTHHQRCTDGHPSTGHSHY